MLFRSGDFRLGLPDRIRTYGLQSRSLTRYPAVPRVDRIYIVTEVLYHDFQHMSRDLKTNITTFGGAYLVVVLRAMKKQQFSIPKVWETAVPF